MVKGLSRKIIVVKSPDPKIFEQAIFIVKDDYLLSRGIDQKELMRQANEAASAYVNRTYKRKSRNFIKILLGGVVSAAVLGIVAAIYYSFI